jgi:hypothetical protein
LKKGYATVWDQCSQKVQDKLAASNDWERTQREQLLFDLIVKIERICVRFDDHKQEIFNLAQALRALFLYTHTEKESVDKFARNFKSLWDTVEAFGGSLGVHKGLVNGLLTTPGQAADPSNMRADKLILAEEETAKVVKAALLISGADKRRYRKLKEEPASNNLLGTNQYPNMLEKASRFLANYQVARPSQFGARRNKGAGLAFIQRGTCSGQGHGGGRGAVNSDRGEGAQAVSAGDAGGGGGDASTIL